MKCISILNVSHNIAGCTIFKFWISSLLAATANVQCECVCVCGPVRTPLRATPEGFINRPQAHLFTHHAHHHLPLTICTPQPSKCKGCLGAHRPLTAQADGTLWPSFPDISHVSALFFNLWPTCPLGFPPALLFSHHLGLVFSFSLWSHQLVLTPRFQSLVPPSKKYSFSCVSQYSIFTVNLLISPLVMSVWDV